MDLADVHRLTGFPPLVPGLHSLTHSLTHSLFYA
jgi:hypothetical protein